MNEEEAKLLSNFDDDIAKHVLSDYEYQIFCMLEQAAKEREIK